MAAVRTVHLRVHGRVQGVGYRWFAAQAGSALALRGWVRNDWDGTVELLAAGPSDTIDRFIATLRRGPAHAHVDTVDVEDRPSIPDDGNAEFEIVP